jgi:hypothetical protein
MKRFISILVASSSFAYGSAVAQAHSVVLVPASVAHGAVVQPDRGRHIIKFSPSGMVRFHLGDHATRTITAILGGPPDTTTQLIQNTCGSGSSAIATIDGTFAQYGQWLITPGAVNGKCLFVVKDAQGYTGRGHVVNKSN